MATKYDSLVLECDQLIKAGNIAAVCKKIESLNFAKIPRPYRQPLAKVCRRVNLVYQGLRLLQPIIRDERSEIARPTPAEICEFAVLLSRNGSVQEAMALLNSVDASKFPEADLFKGYCCISLWEYAKAAEFLFAYLQSLPDPYSTLIARVNLISCLLATYRLAEAEQWIQETLSMAETANAIRLAGNCYEMQANLFIQKKDFKRARAAIDRAAKIFPGQESFEALFLKKWSSLMKAEETRSIEPLLEFRANATGRNQWEGVREADLFLSKIHFDQDRLNFLTFGTPLRAYRERIAKEIHQAPAEQFIFGNDGNRLLNISTGEVHGSQVLNPGKKTHQVIAALIKDFYAPRSLGALFAEIYPNEYFNVDSSPLKIRKILSRTRQWLEANKIPAKLQQTTGGYTFSIHGSFGILIPLERPKIDSATLQLNQLRELGVHLRIPFTAKLACDRLGWSRAQFLIIVERAIEVGLLTRHGIGKSIRYSFQNQAVFNLKPAA